MSHLSYKTLSANKETANKEWLLVDVADQPLGRVASKIAALIRGKHKVNFTPHVDCGDNVVVINAEKIKVTGNKNEQKMYYRHTGYPGGIKSQNFNDLIASYPDRIITSAVKGMLPKNKLGREISKHIRIYKDSNHGHEAQQPKEWSSN